MTGTTSANITVGQAKEISPSVTSKFDPVTSAVSIAAGGKKQSRAFSSSSTTRNTSASSQNHQAQLRKTKEESQTTTITAVRQSLPSSSSSGHATQLKTTYETFLSGKTISSFASSVSHMLVTKSKMLTAPTSTDRMFSPSNVNNTSPVTSASSQNHQNPSMKTTRGTQTTITAVRTSTLSSSTHAHKSTEGTSQRTSPSAPGPAVTWSSTTRFTSHPSLLSVTGTSPTFTGSTMKAETSGKITTSQRADSGGSTASLPSTTSQTLTTSTPGTSTGVLLFPYGPSAGDGEFVRRTMDFTSPLFKPQIGFPLGSFLLDSLYEYETLYDDYNTLVQKVESSINMLTKTGNYKARWMLKITWVHVPAYPARVTIGSGDGYFKNGQLTFHPVWEKYRPDQFLDSNTGLQGLWIYELYREVKPNYRFRCLQWLKREPQWPSWGWNQISCPCSWNQGVLDLRFQSISRGSRQLCSSSSWRGGVCCRYGP